MHVADAGKFHGRGRAPVTTDAHQSERTVIQLAAFFLGFSVGLSRYLNVGIGPFTIPFTLGVIFGAVGWWKGVTDAAARSYVRYMFPFVAIAVLSLVANSAIGELKTTGGILAWLVLIPGIAVMVEDRQVFRAMLLGLMGSAAVYLGVVDLRLLAGRSALDRGTVQLLGVNRNAIDLIVVWLVPVAAVAPDVRLPKWARVAFVGSAVVWLIASKGRTGSIALMLVPLILVALRPLRPGRSRGVRLFLVAGVGALGFIAFTNVNVSWLPASDRVEQAASGEERSSSDEIRIMLNRKSLAITEKNPVLGIGFGRYAGAYDPVIEESATPHIRNKSLTLPAHNTYYEVAATTGVLGVFTFVGGLLMILVWGVRSAADPTARALATGYAVILFSITFHTTLGTILWLPMALVLGAAVRVRREQQLL